MAFKNGKFFSFNQTGVMVARPWLPMAWCKTPGKPWWRAYRPDLHFPPPIHYEELDQRRDQLFRLALENPDCADELKELESRLRCLQPLRLFVQSIPRSFWDAIHPFPHRHWHLLGFRNRHVSEATRRAVKDWLGTAPCVSLPGVCPIITDDDIPF